MSDAKKSQLDIDYVSGEEVEKHVDQIYSMPPEVRENLQFLMRKTGKN